VCAGVRECAPGSYLRTPQLTYGGLPAAAYLRRLTYGSIPTGATAYLRTPGSYLRTPAAAAGRAGTPQI
jgi:hypothetical protein